jgi:hypothetical protein
MEPLRQALLAKIKTLNETVWERRATQPAIEDWLSNFARSNSASQSEELHALFLLSNFMYFGSRQIRELLKAVYRDLYRYPIVQSIRRANSDSLDSTVIEPLYKAERNVTRFLGVGNPSESGCHLLYYFRQENGLPKDLFIHTHQLFTRVGGGTLGLRDPAITRYVFIDDFCGSGKQGTEYSRDLVEDIKRLNPNVAVAYYVLFATAQGMNRIRSETLFDDVRAVYELDTSFKCFSTDSRYFRTKEPEIDSGFCEQMCKHYGEKLVGATHSLGFDNSQLLIGFHHNTPDNTLPIIWFDEPGKTPWNPIFRRYPKLEW